MVFFIKIIIYSLAIAGGLHAIGYNLKYDANVSPKNPIKSGDFVQIIFEKNDEN